MDNLCLFWSEVEDNRPRLVNYIRRKAHCNADDAEDILHEACLKVLKHPKNLNNFGKDEATTIWSVLAPPIRTKIYDRWARNKHSATVSMEASGLAFSDAFLTPQGLVEDRIHYDMVIAFLGKRHNTSLLVYQQEGFTVQEIAEMLGLEQTTVRTRLHRGREELRRSNRIKASVFALN